MPLLGLSQNPCPVLLDRAQPTPPCTQEPCEKQRPAKRPKTISETAEQLLKQYIEKHAVLHNSTGVACAERDRMSAQTFSEALESEMFKDLLHLSEVFPSRIGVPVLSQGYENWRATGTCFPTEHRFHFHELETDPDESEEEPDQQEKRSEKPNCD